MNRTLETYGTISKDLKLVSLKSQRRRKREYGIKNIQWNKDWKLFQIGSVQSSPLVVSDSLWPHESQKARPPCPSSNPGVLHKLMSTESVTPSSHLIFCHPLLLLHSIFPSIRVFSKESTLHMRWPKYWSFSSNISPSNEHPGLIFRMDWLDLLSVQRTLKSLL